MMNFHIPSLSVSNLEKPFGLEPLTRLPRVVFFGHRPIDLYPPLLHRPTPNPQVHFWLSLV
jgi:hypothetical protein